MVRFLLGAGEAVIYPAANQFIARWIPMRERGIANGWIFAGVGAGAPKHSETGCHPQRSYRARLPRGFDPLLQAVR